jgi:hypothetical protein
MSDLPLVDELQGLQDLPQESLNVLFEGNHVLIQD